MLGTSMRNFRLSSQRTAVFCRKFSSVNIGAGVNAGVRSGASVGNGYVSKKVGYWLLGMGGLVSGMVTVGGITRLTRSGLSMTDWRLQGSIPPMTAEEWECEFSRYKQFPEWQQRKSMSLDEFKFIYFWEYGHRMFGRVIGAAFVVPCCYFISRGMIPKSLFPRLGALFCLGGGQGLVGWWMVKSGLSGADVEEKKKLNQEIRVSPYRLATHLSVAFTTYGLLVWTGLDILRAEQAKSVVPLSARLSPIMNRIKKMVGLNTLLVAITVVSGAYVAGNDAGRAFNTFPKMGDEWIPSGYLDEERFKDSKWRNLFENTAAVQFNHRYLAMGTLASISAIYYKVMTNAALLQSLPAFTKRAFHAAFLMAWAQVGLGISTLLLYVPIPLAAVHQAGSLVLLTFKVALLHSLKYIK